MNKIMERYNALSPEDRAFIDDISERYDKNIDAPTTDEESERITELLGSGLAGYETFPHPDYKPRSLEDK